VTKISQFGVLTALSTITMGCAPIPPLPVELKTQSAGQTGCVPDAIEVSKGQFVPGGYMWNATCNGKKYLCTDLSSGAKSAQVSCAPAPQ
jgi:hypothetical protein